MSAHDNLSQIQFVPSAYSRIDFLHGPGDRVTPIHDKDPLHPEQAIVKHKVEGEYQV